MTQTLLLLMASLLVSLSAPATGIVARITKVYTYLLNRLGKVQRISHINIWLPIVIRNEVMTLFIPSQLVHRCSLHPIGPTGHQLRTFLQVLFGGGVGSLLPAELRLLGCFSSYLKSNRKQQPPRDTQSQWMFELAGSPPLAGYLLQRRKSG